MRGSRALRSGIAVGFCIATLHAQGLPASRGSQTIRKPYQQLLQECNAAHDKLLQVFQLPDACEIDEARLSNIIEQWKEIQLGVCEQDDRITPDQILLRKSVMRVLRDRGCAAARRVKGSASATKIPAPGALPPVTDFAAYRVPRFFSDEINRIISAGLFANRQNGRRVSYKGRDVSMMDLAKISVSIFRNLAHARGIPEGDISRAMLEGRLNPHWDDLELVSFGLLPYVADPGDERYGRYFLALDMKWSDVFGSVEEISTVRTIVGGEWRDVTGKEMRQLQYRAMLGVLSSTYQYFSRRRPGSDVEVSGPRRDYHLLRSLSLDKATADEEYALANERRARQEEAFRNLSSTGTTELSISKALFAAFSAVAAAASARRNGSGGNSPDEDYEYTCPFGSERIGHFCYPNTYNTCPITDAACNAPVPADRKRIR